MNKLLTLKVVYHYNLQKSRVIFLYTFLYESLFSYLYEEQDIFKNIPTPETELLVPFLWD